MKIINIRKSVFETNSSSTHCIVFDKDTKYLIDDSYKNLIDDDRIKIHLDEDFGWSCEQHKTFNYKLAYIFQTYFGNFFCDLYKSTEDKSRHLEEHQNNLQSLNNLKDIFIKLDTIVKEITGYNLDPYFIDDISRRLDTFNTETLLYGNDEYLTYDYYGHVDHCDSKWCGIVEKLLNNENDLRRYLFDKNSYLFCSNDNSGDAGDKFDIASTNNDYYGGN